MPRIIALGSRRQEIVALPRSAQANILIGRWKMNHAELAVPTGRQADLVAMLAIINDAAQACRRVIPTDRWHEPCAPMEELVKEIGAGRFLDAEAGSKSV